MDLVVDRDTVSVPLLRSPVGIDHPRPAFERALEAARDEEWDGTSKATLGMPRDSDRRATPDDLPAGWDAPIAEKWWDDRECLPGDHFYEALQGLCGTRGAGEFESSHYESCHDFDAASYPDRALAVEYDLDAGSCLLAGLAAATPAERREVIDSLRAAPDDASAYELVARSLVAAVPLPYDEPGWADAAASVAADAFETAIAFSHYESYGHYGHGDIGVGSVVEVANGAVTVRVDRRVVHDPEALPHAWLLYGGTVKSSTLADLDQGAVVALDARAVSAVRGGGGPVSPATLLDALADDVGDAVSVGALAALVDHDEPVAHLLADDPERVVPYLDHETDLVVRFARSLLYAVSDSRYAGRLTAVDDRLFALARECPTDSRVLYTLRYAVEAAPEAYTDRVEPLLDIADDTGALEPGRALSALASLDPDLLTPHVDRLVDYVVAGRGCTRNMAEEVLLPVAAADPDVIAPHLATLVDSADDIVVASFLTDLFDRCPDLAEGWLDDLVVDPGDASPARWRSVASLARTLADRRPEWMTDHLDVVLEMCDESNPGVNDDVSRRGFEAVAAVALADPDAVTPYVGRLATLLEEYYGVRWHDHAPYAKPFLVLAVTRPTSLEELDPAVLHGIVTEATGRETPEQMKARIEERTGSDFKQVHVDATTQEKLESAPGERLAPEGFHERVDPGQVEELAGHPDPHVRAIGEAVQTWYRAVRGS